MNILSDQGYYDVIIRFNDVQLRKTTSLDLCARILASSQDFLAIQNGVF